ncbi:MAG: O-antigen ligase family protein [Selenomonadaceae bacterium]|nr:O-antigen ligase family protein [Selenomonadaceae bacterium]
MSIVKLRQEKNKQTLKKYILYALLAEVFFIPLSPTLATIALLIGIILTGWRFYMHRLLKVTPLQFDTPIIIFIAISALSIFVSPDKFFSFYNFYNLVGVYALTYFLIGQNIETSKDLKLTMGVLFAAFIVSVLYGYWQAIFGISASDVKWVDGDAFPELKRRIFSTWENPNIFAGFLDMCIALLLGIYAKSKYNKEKTVCAILMILGAGALIYTYARGAMLALIAVVAVYGFLKDKKLLVICVILGVAALAVNPIMLERVTSVFAAADTSSEMRLAFWEATIAMIEDHPLLGIGWGAYFMVYPEYDFYMQGEKILIVHAHNIYLNYAAEIGVLGTLAFFWYFFGTMNLAFTAKFGEEKNIVENEVKLEKSAEDEKIIPVDEVSLQEEIEEPVVNKEKSEDEGAEKPADEVETFDLIEKDEETLDEQAAEEIAEKVAEKPENTATAETVTEDEQKNIEEKEESGEKEEDAEAIEQEEEKSGKAEASEDAKNRKEAAEEAVHNETVAKEIVDGAAKAIEIENIVETAEEIAVSKEAEEKKFSFSEFLKEPFFEDRESLQRGVSLGIGLAFVTVALNGLTDDLLFNIPTSMFLWMLSAIAAKNVKIEK